MRVPRRESGFALILVLMLVAVASILGVSYLCGASLHVVGSTNLIAADRARYLAESGLEHALYVLQSAPESLQASSAAAPLGPFFADGSNDTYTLYAAPGAGTDDLYTIVATGFSGGMKQAVSSTVRCSNEYAEKMQALAPAAYWRLGEDSGAVAADATGAHAGAYANGTALGRNGALIGGGNTAAHFDGINDYVDTGQWKLADPGAGVTLAVWFKADDLDNIHETALLAKSEDENAAKHIWSLGTKWKDKQLNLRFVVTTDKKNRELRAGSGTIQAGRWVFAVGVYDGVNMILYENGAEVGRIAQSGGIKQVVEDDGDEKSKKSKKSKKDKKGKGDEDPPVWIGSCPTQATKIPWQGDLDEVAVFNKALTPEQIADLYGARLPTPEIVRWND